MANHKTNGRTRGDAKGNVNVTPVTLGTCVGVNVSVEAGGPEYHFAFSVRRRSVMSRIVAT